MNDELSFGEYFIRALNRNNTQRSEIINKLDKEYGTPHKVLVYRVINDQVSKDNIRLFVDKLRKMEMKDFMPEDDAEIEKSILITDIGKKNYIAISLMKRVFDKYNLKEAEPHKTFRSFDELDEINIISNTESDINKESRIKLYYFFKDLCVTDNKYISEIIIKNTSDPFIMDLIYCYYQSLSGTSDDFKIFHLINLYEFPSDSVDVLSAVFPLFAHVNSYMPFVYRVDKEAPINLFSNELVVKINNHDNNSDEYYKIAIFDTYMKGKDIRFYRETDGAIFSDQIAYINNLFNNELIHKCNILRSKGTMQEEFPESLNFLKFFFSTVKSHRQISYSFSVCPANLFLISTDLIQNLSEKFKRNIESIGDREEIDKKLHCMNSKLASYNISNDFSIYYDNSQSEACLYFSAKGLESFCNDRRVYGHEILDDIYGDQPNYINKFDDSEMKEILESFISRIGSSDGKIKIFIIDDRNIEQFSFPQNFSFTIINEKYLIVEHINEVSYWMCMIEEDNILNIFNMFMRRSLKVFCMDDSSAISYIKELLYKFS
jgi:hypothetical protein